MNVGSSIKLAIAKELFSPERKSFLQEYYYTWKFCIVPLKLNSPDWKVVHWNSSVIAEFILFDFLNIQYLLNKQNNYCSKRNLFDRNLVLQIYPTLHPSIFLIPFHSHQPHFSVFLIPNEGNNFPLYPMGNILLIYSAQGTQEAEAVSCTPHQHTELRQKYATPPRCLSLASITTIILYASAKIASYMGGCVE